MGFAVKLFENERFCVSQGFLSGWRIEDKLSRTTLVPNWLMKERIGLVWMQVRRTRKASSVNSHFSERVMFESFAIGVAEPMSIEGRFWADHTPNEIAEEIITAANALMRP